LVEVLRLAFDGYYLPATTQPDLLRTDGHPRQAAMVEPPVALLPLTLRGENPAERAGVWLCPECRFGCL
jgi:hypothetical protein